MKKVNVDAIIKKMTLKEKAAQLTQFNGILLDLDAKAEATGGDMRF